MFATLQTWGPVVMVVVGVALAFRKQLLPAASSAYGWLTTWRQAAPAKPDRDAAIDSFNAAYAYLETVGNDEGMKAMLLALPCFYHKPGEHS